HTLLTLRTFSLFFFTPSPPPPTSPLFPYTTLFRSLPKAVIDGAGPGWHALGKEHFVNVNCGPDTWSWTNGMIHCTGRPIGVIRTDRKSTRLNSSHVKISYAVFCLKKKKKENTSKLQ